MAQFLDDAVDNLGTLYCADRISRWQADRQIEPAKDFDRLLQQLDRDPSGSYWG